MLRSVKHLALTSRIFSREEAQDLVEYALLIALMGFAVTTGARAPAVQLNNALTNIANALASKIT
jgi:pilus assembly protein Flp/PilA